ncbi:Gfo/Idh/MocA family protein [Melghirimyces algeriensis]|uniref:Predicted dehydrogenase n=1 Tax=Melghirimyces algeriensis TaxID=910412 RepID=A0A521D4K7_9BACL|nr:Gfo/Idh/MocA family oxidoreductase [Melghirimyces algeriensis]SMO66643.1 Predicted dehydrogenase [Melghirimyces algeriensis]
MIRYGIIGCGHIAKKHKKAIDDVDGAKLVRVCDKDPDKLTHFTEQGVSGSTDVMEILTSPDVDVVNICTPSGLHADLTVRAAEQGKHIVVEKPMALTLTDAVRMVQACDHHGVQLSVVHPNRFRPAIRALRCRVEEGAFGTFSHANATVRWNRDQEYYDQASWRGTRRMDGGVLMNQAIHNLDLLLWMMGEVEKVSSFHSTRLRNIETEDTSVSILTFKNGALGVVEAAVTLYPRNLEESLSLFGETGTAVVGGPTANWIQAWKFADMTDGETEAVMRRVNDNPYGIPGHHCLIQDMTEAVQKGSRPLVTGEDGMRALSLAVACQRSAETGQSVYIDDLLEEFVGKEGEMK